MQCSSGLHQSSIARLSIEMALFALFLLLASSRSIAHASSSPFAVNDGSMTRLTSRARNYLTSAPRCTDEAGSFPCSCLALSPKPPIPPDDCCEGCIVNGERAHILFWPVDLGNTTAHKETNTKVSTSYTMVRWIYLVSIHQQCSRND